MKVITDKKGNLWYVPCDWSNKCDPKLVQGQRARPRFNGISIIPILLRRGHNHGKKEVVPFQDEHQTFMNWIGTLKECDKEAVRGRILMNKKSKEKEVKKLVEFVCDVLRCDK